MSSRRTPEAALNWEQRLSVELAKRRWIAPLTCLALAVVITLPLFVYGFPKGGDAVKHYRWATDFARALGDGSLYPRWFPYANYGMGSPLPIYYPPLPFYVATAINAVTSNMLTALSLSCWLALALSGLTMYGFGRSSLSRPMSLLAAALYMLIPYHILDLYQGSALSEFWCFAWLPLIFYFTFRVCEETELRAAAGLTLSYALLLQTHVLGAFLISLALVVFALLLTRDIRRLIRVAGSMALGAGISAIFIVPVLFERKYIHIERNLRHDYKRFFLFEHLGSAFKAIVRPSDGNDYVVQADLAGLGVLLLLVVSAPPLWNRWRAGQENASRTRLWLALLMVTVLSLLMVMRVSAPLWRLAPSFSFIQFPFRWLLISSAGATLLAAAAVSVVSAQAKRRITFAAAFVVVTVFNLTVSLAAIVQMPKSMSVSERGQFRRESPEYHPVWWDGEQHRNLQETSGMVASGNALVRAIDDSGVRQIYEISASTESVLRFRPLYFPGWVARVDDRPIEIRPSEIGNIELKIEPGEHRLTLAFEDTWPRRAGKLISAASLLCFLALAFVRWRKRRLQAVALMRPGSAARMNTE